MADLEYIDPTNLNTGEPWREVDDHDLKWLLNRHIDVSRMADFLCRTQKEVRERIRHLCYGEMV